MTNKARQIDEALDRSASYAPFLVDFDETLWLRNSTEAFLDSARPRWIAALILRALELCRPWTVLPGPRREQVWRDWIRVVCIVLAMPWSLPRWRKLASGIAQQHWNEDLLAKLQQRPGLDVYIVTNGFRCIVEPMLDGLKGCRPTLLASPLWTAFEWRRRGKRTIVEAALGADRVAKAVFLTDNDEDADLLGAVAQGFHVTWPGAAYISATRDTYVPFDYIEKVKRPGQRWFVRNLMMDELPIILLAYAWFAADPVRALVVLVLAHMSFWTIYEAGYVENDRLGAKLEADPVLTKEFHAGGDRCYSERGAWLYAFGLAGIAATIMTIGGLPSSGVFGSFFGVTASYPLMIAEETLLWMLFLLGARGLFHVYNQLPKRERVVPHLLLQLCKCMGFMLWFDLAVPGVTILLAHAISLWLPYLVYRYGRPVRVWEVPDKELRLVLFLTMIGMFTFSAVEVVTAESAPIALMTLFLVYRVVRSRRISVAEDVGPPPADRAPALV